MKSLDLLKQEDLIKTRKRENENECLLVYLCRHSEKGFYWPSLSYADQPDCMLLEALIKKNMLGKSSTKIIIGSDCLNLA